MKKLYEATFCTIMRTDDAGAVTPSQRLARSTHARVAVAIMLSLSLGACASQGGATQEDNIGSFMVAPGKYQFYACPNLAQTLAGLKVREAELAGLIQKAGPGTGGSIVSAVAYQPEYIQTRGNIIAVRKEAEAKACPAQVIEPPPVPVRPVAPRRSKR